MKMFATVAIVALTITVAGLGAMAYAHGPGGYWDGGAGMHGSDGQSGMGYGMHGSMGFGSDGGAGFEARVNTRLESLENELNLTNDQTPAWDAFAAAVREQTSAMIATRSAMHATRGNLETHSALMQARLDGMNKLAGARNALYGVLTTEQQAVFDRVGPYGFHG